jgi:RND family efflux transporter MFP subunit
MRAGQTVKAGQTVFLLTPLLTPDGQATLAASLAEAEEQVNNANTQLALTRIAHDWARRVVKEGAGSQRQVDEAEAAHNLASRTLDAAAARHGILKRVLGDAEAGSSTPIEIDVPEDGILRTISALPGQTVPIGAALFEEMDISTVWVRVPLPVGDLDAIEKDEPVQVGRLSASAGTRLETAQPAQAPPSANPGAATIDLFYELANASGKLIPGQRLGVTIALADPRRALTCPWSGVVIDIHGGTWVYEQVDPRRYVRRRVIVAYTVGDDAVLATGPPAGTKIAATGAQELFGAETGFVK